MLNLVYPTAAVWREIEADLVAKDRANRVGLKLFPVETDETFKVRWSQKDNAYGLMSMRGLDGSPTRVQRVGMSSFVYEPAVYGNYIEINETEILNRASPTNLNAPIPIGDLVSDADRQLIQLMDDRMEANIWTLLTTGTLNIALPGPNGPIIYKDSYTFQTFTATVPWATAATATPLKDFQTVQQLHVGHGTSFGSDATTYMNQVTANLMLNNTNASDFGGRRSQYGQTLNNLPAFNNYMGGQNLPQIQIVDDGYQPYPISGPITTPLSQFIKFLPDHTFVTIGRRPGNAPVGKFKQTIQAMQPEGMAAGEYRFIKDYTKGVNAPLNVPPKVEVHRGFNGGQTVEFPSAIVIGTV